MRFEVPQFIEVEDKIFGPLTWRQFLYLGGGVGMAVALFFIAPFVIFAIVGIPLAALGGALAFYPINNRNFSYFLEALFNYFSSQRLYLWRRNENIVYRGKEASPKPQIQTAPNPPIKARPKKSITSLTRKLELQALQKSE